MARKESENSKKSKNVLENSKKLDAMRRNIRAYAKDTHTTLAEIADKAEIPLNTLNTLLYRYTSDCNLSTAIALAKVMGITIDELISADILEDETYQNIKICRYLPEFRRNYIRWTIRHQVVLESLSVNGQRFIPVQCAQPTNDKVIKATNNFRMIDTSKCGLTEDVFNKSFFGLQLNCMNYYPIYDDKSIILIANDRNPLPREHCLVGIKDTLYIVECRYNGSTMEFYSIRDGKFRTTLDKVSELVGYITTVVPDTSIAGNL